MKAAIFTGSRRFSSIKSIFKVLAKYSKYDIIIQGDCPSGADLIVKTIGRWFGKTIIPMPAQWDIYGKSAGPKRNKEMLKVLLSLQNCGYSVRVEAFPTEESTGTYDMLRQARKEKVKTKVYG
jgi:hypothetical protein